MMHDEILIYNEEGGFQFIPYLSHKISEQSSDWIKRD